MNRGPWSFLLALALLVSLHGSVRADRGRRAGGQQRPARSHVQGAQSGAAPGADAPQQTFRSSLDLVTIQASVRDHRGRPMRGLTPADFEVRDNGQLRPVLSLRADLQSPLSLAILVDMSGSMRIGSKIAMARQAFAAVLSQLRDGEDEVALFAFDSALHERQPFTTDLGALKNGLSAFQPFGTTSLYDATADTARRLAERSATHKAIIV